MLLYKKIKPTMTRGTFYGIEYDIHLHIAEDKKSGVITAYNLTSRRKKVVIQLDPSKYGLNVKEIEVYNGKYERIDEYIINEVNIEIEIPPLSPIIAILKK